MTGEEVVTALYGVAKDEDLPWLDDLMCRAGFRDENGEMTDKELEPLKS